MQSRSLSSLPRSARHLKQQSAVSTTICARARSRSIGVQFQPRETWRRHCAGIQSVVREEAEPFLLLASMTINLAGATVTLRKTDTAAAGRCDRTAPPRSGSSATLLSDCLSVHPSIHQLPQLHIHKKPFQDKSPLTTHWLGSWGRGAAAAAGVMPTFRDFADRRRGRRSGAGGHEGELACRASSSTCLDIDAS